MAKQTLSADYIKSVIRGGAFGSILSQMVSKQYASGEYWGMLNIQLGILYWLLLYLLEKAVRSILPREKLENSKLDYVITFICALLIGVPINLYVTRMAE
jgi:hypothetical protein